jgi:hypothetical protein
LAESNEEREGLCNGRREGSSVQAVMAESKRDKSREVWRRERKWEEKKKVSPVTVINWDPQKN